MFRILNYICDGIDYCIVNPIENAINEKIKEFKEKHLIIPLSILLVFIVMVYCALKGII